MTFSEKLTELRKNAVETQDALGEVLGVSGKTISKWESAATEPDLAALLAIADHYGVSVDTLLGRGAPMTVPELMKKEMREQPNGAAICQKAFEYSREIICAMWGGMDQYDHMQDAVPVFDKPFGDTFRSNMEHPLAAMLTYHTQDVRMSMQVFRNPAQFAWLRDNRDALADFFGIFADPDALTVLYTLNRADFSEDFTSVYLAEKAGVTVEKTEAVLEKLQHLKGISEPMHLSRSTVETLEGERVVYNYSGSGALMGLFCIAQVLLTGWAGNNCWSWNDVCKLIGEKGENA
ncbi:MAG: helix-turn-helix transcriptional regulator [Clostridia bacterium]|nr:helix-turn-helix transcriptional regulator [Clostridia bacterium]